MSNIQPFHLAISVNNLEKARRFYRDILGLTEGRNDTNWVDFNFFGHQLVLHLREKKKITPKNPSMVDSINVPVPHFGIVLRWDDFHDLANRLKEKNVTLEIEPTIRFKGKIGEQITMFFYDPSGNALEFKAFKDQSKLFAS